MMEFSYGTGGIASWKVLADTQADA